MIYPHTFYNVSYSWYCSLSSHHEHLFKKGASSRWPPHQSIFQKRDGHSQHQIFFFTLPNSLDNDRYIHLLQWGTCLYNIQDLDPEDIAEWKRKKKNWARKQKMRRIREVAEKLVQLKGELGLMHKQSRTESGQLGIVWWNWEYWDSGMGLKRLRTLDNGLQVKKEEPTTPSLHVKIESPPTPCIHYPSSFMSLSCFHSIDPNNFVYSPRYSPSP